MTLAEEKQAWLESLTPEERRKAAALGYHDGKKRAHDFDEFTEDEGRDEWNEREECEHGLRNGKPIVEERAVDDVGTTYPVANVERLVEKLQLVTKAVRIQTDLIQWANTPREIAAVRYVLGYDRREAVDIARSLGISRQNFNTSVSKAKGIKEAA